MTISHYNLTAGAVVVTISGRVALGTASEQIDRTTEHVLGEGKHTIIFDLAGITGMDSTGIGQLISSYKKIAVAGRQMRIAGATGHIADVFRVCKLDTVIPFFTTVEDAANT